MQVVLIGTGNVATVLSKLIVAKGHIILEVIGRELQKASIIALPIGAKATNNIQLISLNADIYIIAVNDDAIVDIAEQLLLKNKLVVHTAGSINKNVLRQVSNNYGVLWPLQSLRKETITLPDIPFVIDASNNDSLNILEMFAKSLSEQCFRANDEDRIKLHLSAVVVSNFTNHLFTLVENYCELENLDFKLLLPLINQTIKRLDNNSPKNLQTGPAIRGDFITINTHINILENHPALKALYQVFSNSISYK
jgi:predicted short-subunit dehydrogenase-like oxidoreductase (DUF2520 family)